MTLRVLLALMTLAATLAASGLRLGGEPFLPYRINHALVSQADGVLGKLELQGQRWDGSKVTLFRTRVKARSQAVELAFYLDEDIRRLILQVGAPETPQALVVELAPTGTGVMTAEESAVRIRMRRLTPPVYLAPTGKAPQRFTLPGSELATAGLLAASSLFRIPISPVPLGLLGGFSGLALLITVLPSGARGWKPLARVFATGMATLAILFLADRRPTLFSVTFPGDDPDVVSGLGPDTTWGNTRGDAEGAKRPGGPPRIMPDVVAGLGPASTWGSSRGDAEGAKRPGGPPSIMSDTRLSGTFERRVDLQRGYRRVAYLAGQGSVELVGLWAPSGPGLPLEAVLPPGALIRFSAAPLLTVVDGTFHIGAKEFVTGWVVHESR